MKKLKRVRSLIFFSIVYFINSINSLQANQEFLKLGAIPDQNQEILNRRFNLLSNYLSKELNIKVKYVPVVNYLGAVTAFRTNDLDLVWFGGLTGIQARLQKPGSIIIAQRNIDKEFKSVFIANKKLKLKSAKNINDLKKLKNTRFTFGSENSTSGRLMPEYYLNLAGLKVSDFKGKRVGFSGSHDATIALVNSGSFDAGALNKIVLENNLIKKPKRTKNIDIFFITPGYANYHWLAQPDLDRKFGKGFTDKIKSAFFNLNKNNQSEKEILEMFGAEKFINPNINEYKKLENIARKLKKIR